MSANEMYIYTYRRVCLDFERCMNKTTFTDTERSNSNKSTAITAASPMTAALLMFEPALGSGQTVFRGKRRDY